MSLGDHKITDEVIVDGVVVGHTESSNDFRVGKHCIGTTYNGQTVGFFALDANRLNMDSPHTSITDRIGKDAKEFTFAVGGMASLDDWEKLFEDTLHHVRRLKAGHEL